MGVDLGGLVDGEGELRGGEGVEAGDLDGDVVWADGEEADGVDAAALGTTAPEGSVTMPVTEPVTVWACASGAARVAAKARNAARRVERCGMYGLYGWGSRWDVPGGEDSGERRLDLVPHRAEYMARD